MPKPTFGPCGFAVLITASKVGLNSIIPHSPGRATAGRRPCTGSPGCAALTSLVGGVQHFIRRNNYLPRSRGEGSLELNYSKK